MHDALTQQLAGLFAQRPEVEAVAVAGSRGQAAVGADPWSDIDLYVYTRAPVALEDRRAVVARSGGARRAELGARFWGEGDAWVHAPSGIPVDVMFFDAGWMDAQVDRVLVQHEPSLGYSTCFWHTVRQSRPCFDRAGWFAALQCRAAVDYPEPLRRRIVALNHPVLRGVLFSYAAQIEKAVLRGDRVSTNHRVAALLASYFDCLFAANRLPHPGEKRMAEAVAQRCTWKPEGLDFDLRDLFARAASADAESVPELRASLGRLLDRLDAVLVDSGVGVPAPPGP